MKSLPCPHCGFSAVTLSVEALAEAMTEHARYCRLKREAVQTKGDEWTQR